MSDYKAALDVAHAEALRFLKTVREDSPEVEYDQAEARRRLGTEIPETGTPDDEVIREIVEAARGGITRRMGGRFFAYVIGGIHPAGVAADWLAAAWDDPPGSPLPVPFGCAVDTIAGEWGIDLLGLPKESSCGLVTGATMGNFVGICAARHALLKREGWDVEANGLYGAPEITVVIGAESHPTVDLSLRMAGFGKDRAVRVPTTDQGVMTADALGEALRPLSGPVLIISQAGQINTGACDPFTDIAALAAEKDNVWHHVDGAFGLWAQISPETDYLTKGVELADSWSVDAHKLLNTPYDGAFAIVKDREAHQGAMSFSASYLPQVPGARDPSHFVPELSRRNRGLAIYATIKALGRDGIRAAIEGLHDNTKLMRDLLTEEPGITCVNDVVFNQAIFQFEGVEPDAIALAVRRSGEAWFQSALHKGEQILRCSVADHSTTREDVERAAAAVKQAYRGLR